MRAGPPCAALCLVLSAAAAIASGPHHLPLDKQHSVHQQQQLTASQRHIVPRASTHSHAYVAACVLVKNEHRYIREWLDYHLWLGIAKFYVWDHQSSPPMATVLADYVLANVVELVYFSDSWRADGELYKDMYKTSTRQFMSPQAWAYDNCFRMFSHRHTFMVLFDPDEYIVIKDPPSNGTQTAQAGGSTDGAQAGGGAQGGPAPRPHLPTFLQPFEQYGGLYMQWQLFGPSGHRHRPAGPTLLEYTGCMPKSTLRRWKEFRTMPLGFVKSITATRCYKAGCNPHVCELKEGCKYVNEDFEDPSSRVIKAVHWERIAVFHYVTRSMEDYASKMKRGSGHSQFFGPNRAMGKTNRGWKYFKIMNAAANGTCMEGVDMWKRCCGGAEQQLEAQQAEATGGQGGAEAGFEQVLQQQVQQEGREEGGEGGGAVDGLQVGQEGAGGVVEGRGGAAEGGGASGAAEQQYAHEQQLRLRGADVGSAAQGAAGGGGSGTSGGESADAAATAGWGVGAGGAGWETASQGATGGAGAGAGTGVGLTGVGATGGGGGGSGSTGSAAVGLAGGAGGGGASGAGAHAAGGDLGTNEVHERGAGIDLHADSGA